MRVTLVDEVLERQERFECFLLGVFAFVMEPDYCHYYSSDLTRASHNSYSERVFYSHQLLISLGIVPAGVVEVRVMRNERTLKE